MSANVCFDTDFLRKKLIYVIIKIKNKIYGKGVS